MRRRIWIILAIMTAALIGFQHKRPKPVFEAKDGCVACHQKISDPDRSHPISVFGCQSCHLGNRYSLDKRRAHYKMILRPGDLSSVDKTCGKIGCHGDIAARVKNSLMATNQGILGTLQDNWAEKASDPAKTLQDLRLSGMRTTPATAYYAKMCAGCHLWKNRGDFKGEIGKRGGGCSNCHILEDANINITDFAAFTHKKITTRIPSANCTKCHNRSARIGLSYFGRYESEGYGTPYHGKGLDERRLSGKRFYLNLPEDTHYRKFGMDCIDCHTGTGLMGDGHRYAMMKEQVDITCMDCHAPSYIKDAEKRAKGDKLAHLNGRVPDPADRQIGVSAKDTPLYNIQKKENNTTLFYRKKDAKAVPLASYNGEKKYHLFSGHKRLSCQACHSSWMPQCYGCHIFYEKDSKQWDWLLKKRTYGKWREKRSYMRFLKPALGVNQKNKIVPISQSQVFVSLDDGRRGKNCAKIKKTYAVASFDPHTTVKASRTCLDCHFDPKSLGLGEGLLTFSRGRIDFQPINNASHEKQDNLPLEGFIDAHGNSRQTARTQKARPFNQAELKKILNVAVCLPCHNTYEDRIYEDFALSLKKFSTNKSLPCYQQQTERSP